MTLNTLRSGICGQRKGQAGAPEEVWASPEGNFPSSAVQNTHTQSSSLWLCQLSHFCTAYFPPDFLDRHSSWQRKPWLSARDRTVGHRAGVNGPQKGIHSFLEQNSLVVLKGHIIFPPRTQTIGRDSWSFLLRGFLPASFSLKRSVWAPRAVTGL